MINLYEHSVSSSILLPGIENYYEERFLNDSVDENSFYSNQNLNKLINGNFYFQPELNNSFEEDNEFYKNNFNNIHNEEDEMTPNLDNMPIYNIKSNINNVQNDLNSKYVAHNYLLGRKTKKSGETGPHDKYAEDNRVRIVTKKRRRKR